MERSVFIINICNITVILFIHHSVKLLRHRGEVGHHKQHNHHTHADHHHDHDDHHHDDDDDDDDDDDEN